MVPAAARPNPTLSATHHSLPISNSPPTPQSVSASSPLYLARSIDARIDAETSMLLAVHAVKPPPIPNCVRLASSVSPETEKGPKSPLTLGLNARQNEPVACTAKFSERAKPAAKSMSSEAPEMLQRGLPAEC